MGSFTLSRNRKWHYFADRTIDKNCITNRRNYFVFRSDLTNKLRPSSPNEYNNRPNLTHFAMVLTVLLFNKHKPTAHFSNTIQQELYPSAYNNIAYSAHTKSTPLEYLRSKTHAYFYYEFTLENVLLHSQKKNKREITWHNCLLCAH